MAFLSRRGLFSALLSTIPPFSMLSQPRPSPLLPVLTLQSMPRGTISPPNSGLEDWVLGMSKKAKNARRKRRKRTGDRQIIARNR